MVGQWRGLAGGGQGWGWVETVGWKAPPPVKQKGGRVGNDRNGGLVGEERRRGLGEFNPPSVILGGLGGKAPQVRGDKKMAGVAPGLVR